jgi:hypothetical protein
MSTLSDHQANGNATEATPQSEDATGQIREVLQHFDILSSKAEKHIFTYAYLYIIGFFLLTQLWRIRELPGWEAYSLDYGFTSLSYFTSLGLLFGLGVCMILWTFNIWRKNVPNTLRDIYKKDCIYVSIGDLNMQYLDFLKQYRDALKNPRRYLLSAILIGALVIYIISSYIMFFQYDLGVPISDWQRIIVVISDLVALLAAIIVEIGFMYCLGILFWSVFISGQYIRNLSRTFELRIEPVHPDNCGGLQTLGNFCFASASAPLIGSAFYIGYLLVAAHFAYFELGPQEITLFLFVILLVALPVAIFASFLPLWSIHMKMLKKREKDEEHYVAEIAPLLEKIHVLVDANQLEEAQTLKKKKELLETVHIPYPAWPFNVRTKFFTTILGAGGSLLLGVLTAVLTVWAQAYFHP